MDLKNMIRNIIEESFLVEEGNKDRFILNNDNLTSSQKETLIKVFDERRHLEKGVDWNNWKKLTFDDFKSTLIKASTGALKKLKEKKDYIEVKGFKCDADDFIGAYIPLNHNASHVMASDKMGFTRGKWCIAYDGDDVYWKRYSYGQGSADYYADEPSVFIFVVYLSLIHI